MRKKITTIGDYKVDILDKRFKGYLYFRYRISTRQNHYFAYRNLFEWCYKTFEHSFPLELITQNDTFCWSWLSTDYDRFIYIKDDESLSMLIMRWDEE